MDPQSSNSSIESQPCTSTSVPSSFSNLFNATIAHHDYEEERDHNMDLQDEDKENVDPTDDDDRYPQTTDGETEAPSSDEDEVVEEKLTIVAKSNIKMAEFLGEGGYGKVFRATLLHMRANHSNRFCTVKILRSAIKSDDLRTTCLENLNTLSHLKHRNLVKFIGISETADKNESLSLFSTYVGGSLLTFVKNVDFSKKDIAKILLDIVNGMEYLHTCKITHKHLCARNVLLDLNGEMPIAKVSDYTSEYLCIEGQSANYYKFEEAKKVFGMQIRWVPQEFIPTKVRKTAGFPNEAPAIKGFEAKAPGDVWSFAVLLFETFSKGDCPYGIATSNEDVIKTILRGFNPLTYSSNKSLLFDFVCSEDYLNIMRAIFNPDPAGRPTFKSIKKDLKKVNTKVGNLKKMGRPSKAELERQKNLEGKGPYSDDDESDGNVCRPVSRPKKPKTKLPKKLLKNEKPTQEMDIVQVGPGQLKNITNQHQQVISTGSGYKVQILPENGSSAGTSASGISSVKKNIEILEQAVQNLKMQEMQKKPKRVVFDHTVKSPARSK